MSEKQKGPSFGKKLGEIPSDASSHLQMLVDSFERVSPYAEDAVPKFEFSEPLTMNSEVLPLVQSNTLEICNTDFDERQRTASPTIEEASPEFKEFNYEIPRKNCENWINVEDEPIVDMFSKNKNEMLKDSCKTMDCSQSDRSSMKACFSPRSLVNCELINNKELVAANRDSPCIVYVQKTNGGHGRLPNDIKETKQKLTNSFIPNTNEADFEQNGLNHFIQKDKDNKLCGLLGYIQKKIIFDKSTNISESKTGEISKNSQYYLENQTFFEEKEKYSTKEMEGDIKKPDLPNLNMSSLSEESNYSTPVRSYFGDCLSTLEGIIDENRTHQCDIKNIDSENVIQENKVPLAEKSYHSTPGKTNFDYFLSPSKDITIEIIDETHPYDIKSSDLEGLTQKNTSSLTEEFYLFTSERNNSGESLSNSEAKNDEINEAHECDLKNETNLLEENVGFNQIERMHAKEIETKWCDEISRCITLDAFSNISATKTDEIINEMQQATQVFEKEAKASIVDEGKSNFKQTYPQNLMQASQSTEIAQYSGTKSCSNEFAYASEAISNITNVIKQEYEQTIVEGDIQLPGRNIPSNFSQENTVGGLSDDASASNMINDVLANNLLLNYRQKLRPRTQKEKLDNVSFLSKFEIDTLKSEEEVLDEIKLVPENSVTKLESTEFETMDVQNKKSNSDIIYCFRCKQSIMDTTSDGEAYNAIFEQNKKGLNKNYSIQTLLDLFSIDQTISTNMLKCLSSEEFRLGALLTEIMRYIRQESSLTASSKIKDDVKKFLEAAKDVGWIELKNRRYKLTGYVINSADSEKEANGTASKRKRISKPKNQIKRKKLL